MQSDPMAARMDLPHDRLDRRVVDVVVDVERRRPTRHEEELALHAVLLALIHQEAKRIRGVGERVVSQPRHQPSVRDAPAPSMNDIPDRFLRDLAERPTVGHERPIDVVCRHEPVRSSPSLQRGPACMDHVPEHLHILIHERTTEEATSAQ